MSELFSLPQDTEAIKQIITKIDFSDALLPNATSKMVIEACEKVRRYGFATVCVYPTWVKLAKEQMKDSKSGILVTVGFPHGSTSIEAKIAETKQALKDGATEVDMVINLGRFLDKDYSYVKKDIEEVVKCCKEYDVGVKVIIETGYMSDEEKCTAANIAVEAGAEYIKTCTGFGPGCATLHDILLIKHAIGDKAKIKASGGIASIEDQRAFIEAGASRVAGRSIIIDQLMALGIII